MISWIQMDDQHNLNDLISQSYATPCLIFKHSSRCSISSIAVSRLENQWPFSTDELIPYFLDIIRYRPLSNTIAEAFNVPHESPQILLIQEGKCIFATSHLDISVSGIQKAASIPST